MSQLYKQVGVQRATYADNVALPALAAAVDISCPPGHSSEPVGKLGQTDGHPTVS